MWRGAGHIAGYVAHQARYDIQRLGSGFRSAGTAGRGNLEEDTGRGAAAAVAADSGHTVPAEEDKDRVPGQGWCSKAEG